MFLVLSVFMKMIDLHMNGYERVFLSLHSKHLKIHNYDRKYPFTLKYLLKPCLLVRKPGGPGYEIKMLTDRIVNRSFELADILDWGFPIKSSELAGGNLEATLKEILGLE